MSKKPINLSRLELRVMSPFWKHGEITVREAADVIAKQASDPGYSAVQTVVGRLEKKGAVERIRKVGNAWIFRPIIEQRQVVRSMVSDLLSLLDGTTNPLISTLVESKAIGREELEELSRLIEEQDKAKESK